MALRLLVTCLFLLLPRLTLAECATIRPRDAMKQSDVVFSGVASEVNVEGGRGPRERQRITFEVDRIWKGFVSRRVVIYGETPFMDAFFFRRGTKYFVTAHRPTPDERMELEVFLDTPKTFFVVAGCGGGSYAFSPTSPADPTGLGPGRLP
jgi:hypothetical protein